MSNNELDGILEILCEMERMSADDFQAASDSLPETANVVENLGEISHFAKQVHGLALQKSKLYDEASTKFIAICHEESPKELDVREAERHMWETASEVCVLEAFLNYAYASSFYSALTFCEEEQQITTLKGLVACMEQLPTECENAEDNDTSEPSGWEN